MSNYFVFPKLIYTFVVQFNVMELFDEIKTNVIDWCKNKMPADFTFREYQLDACISIIHQVLTQNKSLKVIEAPTGSGKTLICLISAGVLADYYSKTSYILVSDLFLWQQYEDAILKNNLPFGKLKGTQGNYTCDKNGKDLRLGLCRIKNVPFFKLEDQNFCNTYHYECALTCEYVQNRIYAKHAKVSLMTYQLWLNYMHMLDGDASLISFGIRDVVFCDECHNIPDLVQTWCSPVICKERDHTLITKLFCTLQKYDFIPKTQNFGEFAEDLNRSYDALLAETDNDNIPHLLEEYINVICIVSEAFEKYRKVVCRSAYIENDILKNISIGLQIKALSDFLITYLETIYKTGTAYIIKQMQNNDKGQLELKLQCAKEDVIVHHYLLSKSAHNVMLSATVGQIESYKESLGSRYIDDLCIEYNRIPSTFDFSNSPIIFFRDYNMSFKHIGENFPKVAQVISNIIKSPMFKDERGIIHTGSYLNAQRLFSGLDKETRKRLIYYNNSKDKDNAIQEYIESKNKILIGPTLMEGIDLKDDLCRFLIIAKVPFPQLTDKLVEAKKELFPKWYKSTTNNSIIQGIGRGNRHQTDWCWSFIMDSAFINLVMDEIYQMTSQYPPEFLNRLYEYKSGQYIKLLG